MAGLFALIGLLIGGGAMLHDAVRDADCKSTPYRKTRDGKPVSVTLKGDDYINGEACMSIPYTSEYGTTYYKTIGRRTGKVYEDTKDTVNDRWDAEAKKAIKRIRQKGN